MDKIKVILSDSHPARLKGAYEYIMEDQETIFYDEAGKELWREKDKLRESFHSESKIQ